MNQAIRYFLSLDIQYQLVYVFILVWLLFLVSYAVNLFKSGRVRYLAGSKNLLLNQRK